MCVCFAGTALHAEKEQGAAHADLAGSWMFNVQPNDAFPPPFISLITFRPGGGLVETETDEQLTGQGTWKQTGPDTFTFTLMQLEFNGGAWDGTYIARGTLKYDAAKHTLSGSFTVSFYDPNGNLLDSGGGTLTGSRIEAQ
jgi:hypothetical protein